MQRGAFVSEPAILVRRVNSGSQVWSMEKLENKLVDMRDMYQEYKERLISGRVSATLKSNACVIERMERCILTFDVIALRISTTNLQTNHFLYHAKTQANCGSSCG